MRQSCALFQVGNVCKCRLGKVVGQSAGQWACNSVARVIVVEIVLDLLMFGPFLTDASNTIANATERSAPEEDPAATHRRGLKHRHRGGYPQQPTGGKGSAPAAAGGTSPVESSVPPCKTWLPVVPR